MVFRSGARNNPSLSLLGQLSERAKAVGHIPGVFDLLYESWDSARQNPVVDPVHFKLEDGFEDAAIASLRLAHTPILAFQAFAIDYVALLEARLDTADPQQEAIGLRVARSVDLESVIGELLHEMLLHPDHPGAESRGMLGLLEESLVMLATYDSMRDAARDETWARGWVDDAFSDQEDNGNTVCFLLGPRYRQFLELGQSLGPAMWEAVKDHVILGGIKVMTAEMAPMVRQFEKDMARLEAARNNIRSTPLGSASIPSTMADLNISDYDIDTFRNAQLDMLANAVRKV